jgi:hypothetical protein
MLETTSRENPSGGRLFPGFHFFMLGMKLSPRAMPARALPSGRPGAEGKHRLSDQVFLRDEVGRVSVSAGWVFSGH